jgi:heterodisulfide reductase subunit C
MESLRVMSRREGTVSQQDVQLFYDEFLKSVKRFGRVFETALLPIYSFKSKKPFTDLDLAPRVLKKGKLSIMPPRTEGRKAVSEIFSRFEAQRLSEKSRKD